MFEKYRSVHMTGITPVLGNFLAAGAANTGERFIPSGFRSEYMVRDMAVMQYLGYMERLEWDRANQLHIMLRTCIYMNGLLCQLIVYGIFAHPDNRRDALDIIAYMRNNSLSDPIIGRIKIRCDNLVSLLTTSFFIDDISDVQLNRALVDHEAPRLNGIQLTLNTDDLYKLNEKAMKESESNGNSDGILMYIDLRTVQSD
jgi:hypothetical protein